MNHDRRGRRVIGHYNVFQTIDNTDSLRLIVYMYVSIHTYMAYTTDISCRGQKIICVYYSITGLLHARGYTTMTHSVVFIDYSVVEKKKKNNYPLHL